MYNSFFIIERDDKKKSIKYKNPQKYIDTTIFEKYSEIREKLSLTNNKNIKDHRYKIKELYKNVDKYFGSKYLEKIFNMKDDLQYYNYNKPIKNSKSNYNKKDEKYKNIVTTMGYYNEIVELTLCEREKVLNKYWLHRYLIAFRNLKKDGNMLIPITNICYPETIDLIYLGLLLFNKITIYRGQYLYLEKFDPQIEEKIIIKLLDRLPKLFIVEPKNDLNKLEKYLEYWYKDFNKHYNDIENKNFDNVFEYIYKDLVSKLNDIDSKEYYDKVILIIYKNFYSLFKKVFIEDKILKIHSGIKSEEGIFLKKIVMLKNLNKIAEVGMAFGISSMYITEGLKRNNKNGSLISIDPFQTEQWKDNGVKLLKSIKLDKYHKLIQKKSYIALPELIEKYGEKSFDMIFIDGWHTFDYTLVDVFYADKLVKVGGYIIVDDVLHFSVKQSIKYIDKNYRHFKRLKSPNTFAAYKKINDDDREWNFHIKF